MVVGLVADSVVFHGFPLGARAAPRPPDGTSHLDGVPDREVAVTRRRRPRYPFDRERRPSSPA